jgi:Zn-dependent alcohol dehydrogenase
MKALVVNARGHGFDLEDIDIGAPKGGEVLINGHSSGLCHTDLLFATHDIVLTPAVLGHEVSGIVAEVGPDVWTSVPQTSNATSIMYAELYLQGRINLDDLVSRRIALRDVNEGYAALKDGSLKRVVVTSFWQLVPN